MICPHCGDDHCQMISEVETKGKDFSVGKGFCGAILLWPIGILCGACGEGKQVKTKHYWVCERCGRKFQV